MENLAMLGGAPAIQIPLPTVDNATGRSIGDEEAAYVTEVLRSGKLNYIAGEKTQRFEREFAQKFESKYAVSCSSGTAALHGAILSLDLEPESEVIVAPITDMGTIIPILMQNLIPVFADIDPDTCNLDPESVERQVTTKTRAIIVVHLFGHPVEMDGILSIARKYNLYVIEDCCQAFLSRYNGALCGTIGDVGCFSFQQSKQMTTGDGGMIITNNDKLGRRMRLCVDKGWPRDGAFRDHLFLAPAYHMTELQSAVGIAQLEKLDRMIAARQERAAQLTSLLSDISVLHTPIVKPWAAHTYWKYAVRLEVSRIGTDMEGLAEALHKEGLPCWAGYTKVPIYLYNTLTIPYTYGRSGYPLAQSGRHYREGLCPRAEQVLREMIVLPFCETYTEEHIQLMSDALHKVLRYYTRKDG